MKRHLLTAALVLVFGLIGFVVSGVALANNGNGGKDPGGPNPCPPSQHAVYDQNGAFVSCEDNGNPSGQPGGGIGNCGQNQSGNPGNGGDTGYGNGKDCAVTTDTTPTDTTPTETTPTESTPTETTPTETTPSSPGTPPTGTTPSSPGTPPADESGQPVPPPSGSSSGPSEESSQPPIVGQPPTKQQNPAPAQAEQEQSPAHTAVAGTSAKSEPKPTRQPQPAPFTL